MKYDIYIGLDIGVNTGLAVWNAKEKRLVRVVTKNIISAMDEVLTWVNEVYKGLNIIVRIEDPNKRKWFGTSGRERLQGAGSVKRDYSVWVEFFEHHGIQYESVAPRNVKTKTTQEYFCRLTGWANRTSSHARDAAMQIYGK